MPLTRIIFAVVALLTAGCAQQPVPPEEFGSSVRAMVEAQIYNPPAAQASNGEPAALDGERSAGVVKAYRSEKPTAVTTEDATVFH